MPETQKDRNSLRSKFERSMGVVGAFLVYAIVFIGFVYLLKSCRDYWYGGMDKKEHNKNDKKVLRNLGDMLKERSSK